jgi:hypothetical protein
MNVKNVSIFDTNSRQFHIRRNSTKSVFAVYIYSHIITSSVRQIKSLIKGLKSGDHGGQVMAQTMLLHILCHVTSDMCGAPADWWSTLCATALTFRKDFQVETV